MSFAVLQLLTGIDLLIEECNLIIHQPTLEEIGYISENVLWSGASVLTINKSLYIQQTDFEDLREYDAITNFQIFITVLQQKEAAEQKQNALAVLRLLFPQYSISLLPRSIMFKKDETNLIIDENNFDFLQDAIREILCLQDSGQQSYNPEGARAREIAEKLMRARQKKAELTGENSSILSQYLSVITVGLNSMAFSETKKLTIYQLYDLVERYSLYINWDLDVRTRLAGGKPDSQPDNWMKSIH